MKEKSPYTLKQALTERGKATITMLADTALLAFWVMLAWAFNEYCLEPFGEVSGLDGFILRSLQIILGLPVILQAIAFTTTDLSAMLSSTMETIKEQWKK